MHRDFHRPRVRIQPLRPLRAVPIRNAVDAIGAAEHKIIQLAPGEALDLLALTSETAHGDLPDAAAYIADECGYMPLALSLAMKWTFPIFVPIGARLDMDLHR